MELTIQQREWIDSAREMLDFLEARPTLIPRWGGLIVYPETSGAQELGLKARALGSSEKYASDSLIGAFRSFGCHVVKVMDYRENVCERVQVGTKTEEVTVNEPPEDAEVIDVRQTFVIRREVPVYKTRCPDSLLALAEVST